MYTEGISDVYRTPLGAQVRPNNRPGYAYCAPMKYLTTLPDLSKLLVSDMDTFIHNLIK